MLAQNMTLAELQGETPTPARQEEIDQRMYRVSLDTGSLYAHPCTVKMMRGTRASRAARAPSATYRA